MFFIVQSLSWQINYFIQTPHTIADAGLHCWRDQRKTSYDREYTLSIPLDIGEAPIPVGMSEDDFQLLKDTLDLW